MSQPVPLIDIFKYILAGTAAFIGVVTMVLYLVETIRTKCKTFASTIKTFYVLVMLHQFTRLVLNCIPNFVYRNIFQSGKMGLAAQTVLDLLPEILFYLQYTLILYSWMEIYYLSRSIERLRFEKQRWIQRPVGAILLTAFIIWTIVGLLLLIIAFGPDIKSYSDVSRLQGWFLFSITVITTLFIVIFGIVMCCVYRRGAKFSKIILRSLIKTTILGLIYGVFLLLRAAWVLLINTLLRGVVNSQGMSEDAFSCIWAAYMLVVEQIPIILILIVLQTLAINPRVKKKIQEQEKYTDMEVEQQDGFASKKSRMAQLLDNYDEEMRESASEHLYSPLQEAMEQQTALETSSSPNSNHSSSAFFSTPQVSEELSQVEIDTQVLVPQHHERSFRPSIIKHIDDSDFLTKTAEKLESMEKQLHSE